MDSREAFASGVVANRAWRLAPVASRLSACTFAIGFLALAFFFVVLDESAGVESDAVVAGVLLSAGASILSGLTTVAVLVAERPRWIIPNRLRSSD